MNNVYQVKEKIVWLRACGLQEESRVVLGKCLTTVFLGEQKTRFTAVAIFCGENTPTWLISSHQPDITGHGVRKRYTVACIIWSFSFTDAADVNNNGKRIDYAIVW